MNARARIGLLGVLATLLAGCGGGGGPKLADSKDDTPTQTQTSTTATTDAPASSAAAALRSRLVALQVEETYQTAIAASAGLVNGFDSPGFDDAARSARSTSRTLADTYASAADAPLKSAYRTVWRASTQALLHGAAGQKDAGAQLRRAEEDRENMLLTLSPRLDGRAVAAARLAQLTRLRGAIGASAHRSPTVYAQLVAATAAIPRASELEAAATATAHPDDYAGSATSAVANLRAQLTGDLVSEVHLSALALDASKRGGDAAAANAALLPVDQRLARTVQHDGLSWRTLTLGLDAYAREFVARDDAGASHTLDALHAEGKKLGRHFGSTGMFGPWIDSDAALIRAEAAGSPRVFDRIFDTAQKMPGLAELLADSIASDDPGRYPPK